MPRPRSYHPSMFKDEAFFTLTIPARVLLMGLGTFSDYADRFPWDEAAIDLHVCEPLAADYLPELLDAGLVVRHPDGGEILYAFGHSRRRISKWEALRSRIFRRDNFTCQYCGSKELPLHCDHVVPVSKGGSNLDSNLKAACKFCNLSKHDKTLEEWIR